MFQPGDLILYTQPGYDLSYVGILIEVHWEQYDKWFKVLWTDSTKPLDYNYVERKIHDYFNEKWEKINES